MRLLIAEDNPKLLKSLIHIFTTNDYIVEGVANGTDALNYAQSEDFDGFIFDIMMPEMDGVAVLKELRRKNINTPALFLSAKSEVWERIEGLDSGADDYLPKPFAGEELLARVRAMLRRRDNYTASLLTLDGMTLNCSTFELSYLNKKVALSSKEYQLLEMLMLRPNSIVTTEQFMTHIWGWETDVATNVVWVHLSNIRKKLVKIGAPLEIRFIRNAGYILGAKK